MQVFRRLFFILILAVCHFLAVGAQVSPAFAVSAPVICVNGSGLKGTLNTGGACVASAQTNASLNANFTVVWHNAYGNPFLDVPLTFSKTGADLLQGYGISGGTNFYSLPSGFTEIPVTTALTIPTNDTVLVSCDLGPRHSSSPWVYPYSLSGTAFTGPGTFYPANSNCGTANSGNIVFTLLLPAVSAPALASASYDASQTLVTISGSNFSSSGNTAQITGTGGPWTVSNISSPNGSTLSFALPAGIPAGTYAVAVQAQGTAYSNSASLTVTSTEVQLIALSGSGTTINNPIFGMLDQNVVTPSGLPAMLKISPSGMSIAKESALLQSNINLALSSGKRVLVVGHSLGSLVAYSVVTKYFSNNAAVSAVYVDPPYNMTGILTAFNWASSGNNLIFKIENDPNVVNWTHGLAMMLLFRHDPFDYSWFPGNSANLGNLWALLNARVTALKNAAVTPAAGPAPASLAGSPSFSGLPASVVPGQTVTISGSNFDPTNNTVYIQDASDPSVFYSIYNIAPSGNSLSFQIPYSPDIPAPTSPGTYNVTIAGVNTDWSASFPIVISTPTLAPAPTISSNPSNVALGGSATIGGTNFGATTNIVLTYLSPLNFKSSLTGITSSPTVYALKLSNIPTNGSSATFTIPADLPAGTYSIQAGSDGQALSAGQTILVGAVIVTPPALGDSGAAASVPVVTVYTCPSGYSVSGTSCVKQVSTSNLSIACPAGSYHRIGYGNFCFNPDLTPLLLTATPKVTYSCPSGYTIGSGNVCNLNQGPINLRASVGKGSNSKKVTLTWSNNKVLNAQGIEILRGTTNSAATFVLIKSLGATKATYADSATTPGTTYYYQVRIKYLNGNYSVPTAVVSAKIVSPALAKKSAGGICLSCSSMQGVIVAGRKHNRVPTGFQYRHITCGVPEELTAFFRYDRKLLSVLFDVAWQSIEALSPADSNDQAFLKSFDHLDKDRLTELFDSSMLLALEQRKLIDSATALQFRFRDHAGFSIAVSDEPHENRPDFIARIIERESGAKARSSLAGHAVILANKDGRAHTFKNPVDFLVSR